MTVKESKHLSPSQCETRKPGKYSGHPIRPGFTGFLKGTALRSPCMLDLQPMRSHIFRLAMRIRPGTIKGMVGPRFLLFLRLVRLGFP